jgi:hypothetical protein
MDKCIIFAWSKTVRILFSSLAICQWRKRRSSSSARMLSSSRFACACRSCSGFIYCTSRTLIRPSPVSLLRAQHCRRHTAWRPLQAQGPRQTVHPKNASRVVSGLHQAPWQRRRTDQDDYVIIDKAYSYIVPPHALLPPPLSQDTAQSNCSLSRTSSNRLFRASSVWRTLTDHSSCSTIDRLNFSLVFLTSSFKNAK